MFIQCPDLIAYPLTRHVLNPQAVNLDYDVLAPNIFIEDGKLLGLKTGIPENDDELFQIKKSKPHTHTVRLYKLGSEYTTCPLGILPG